MNLVLLIFRCSLFLCSYFEAFLMSLSKYWYCWMVLISGWENIKTLSSAYYFTFVAGHLQIIQITMGLKWIPASLFLSNTFPNFAHILSCFPNCNSISSSFISLLIEKLCNWDSWGTIWIFAVATMMYNALILPIFDYCSIIGKL